MTHLDARPGPVPATATCTSTRTRYPLAPTATFKPPHAPASAYRAVQRELGLARTVVIQPTGYGFDNRCTLAALAALGPEARAIVVVAAGRRARRARRRCTTLGARGVRYMMLPGGVLPWSGLERTAAAIAPLGWHIDLQLDGRELPLHEAMLARLPCRLVIDHVGRFMGPVEPDSEPLRALCRLLDTRHVLDQDLGAVRKLAQRAAGLRRHRLDRAPGRAPLSRAVPVGEQLAAPEPEPGAVERRDARLGPRLLRRSGGAEEGACRQPGRAVRLRADRRPVNFAQPSASHGLPRKPLRRRRAERRRQVDPGQGAARARLAPDALDLAHDAEAARPGPARPRVPLRRRADLSRHDRSAASSSSGPRCTATSTAPRAARSRTASPAATTSCSRSTGRARCRSSGCSRTRC